jgi:hypothetical protein
MIEYERSHTCLPAGRECTEKQEFSVFSRKALSEKHNGKDNRFECLQKVRMSKQIRSTGSSCLLRMSLAISQAVMKGLLLRGHRGGETRMFCKLFISLNLRVLCG